MFLVNSVLLKIKTIWPPLSSLGGGIFHKIQQIYLSAIAQIASPGFFRHKSFDPASTERKIPPAGLFDRQIMWLENGQWHSRPESPPRKVFNDNEIVERAPVLRREEVTGGVNDCFRMDVEYTKHNKACIQQQAQSGCKLAAAAMLIRDHGGPLPNLSSLRSDAATPTPADAEVIPDYIKSKGFPICKTECPRDLAILRLELERRGSAIMWITDPSAGSHRIVVDWVSPNLKQVRLRDPYHGWEITVTAKAFLSRFPYERSFQLLQIGSARKA